MWLCGIVKFDTIPVSIPSTFRTKYRSIEYFGIGIAHHYLSARLANFTTLTDSQIEANIMQTLAGDIEERVNLGKINL